MEVIELTHKNFNKLSKLIYDESGINIHTGKLELLKSKIAKRMRATRISSTSEYFRFLETNKKEVIEFIDTVTTNHSFFFRENRSIECVVKKLHETNLITRRTFRIWCAACSTGDEPYSVALQLIEKQIRFSLLATDISHSVLSKASKGIYSIERAKNIPEHLLHKYFQKGCGKQAGYIRVKKNLQTFITFEKFNLITDPLPNEKFDAVLCRNVMIYFDHATTQKVVNKLSQAIKHGGYFIIGQAESLMNLTHCLKPVKNMPSTFVK